MKVVDEGPMLWRAVAEPVPQELVDPTSFVGAEASPQPAGTAHISWEAGQGEAADVVRCPRLDHQPRHVC